MDKCTQGALNKQAINELKKQTDTLFTLASKQSSTLNSVSQQIGEIAIDVGWVKNELVGHIKNSVENIRQISSNKEDATSIKTSLAQCWTMVGLMFASVVGMAFMLAQEFITKK